uniref:ORF71 n=1 Tax=Oryza sativa subsp. japonica TaxID=39947 RepID=Q35310_ORYSJ|nr:ORF71 [Oryza sativa Japonica Group]
MKSIPTSTSAPNVYEWFLCSPREGGRTHIRYPKPGVKKLGMREAIGKRYANPLVKPFLQPLGMIPPFPLLC